MTNEDQRSKLAPSSKFATIMSAVGIDVVGAILMPIGGIQKAIEIFEQRNKEKLLRIFQEQLRHNFFDTIEDINNGKIDPFFSAFVRIYEAVRMGRHEERIRYMVSILNGYESAEKVDSDEFYVVFQAVENLSSEQIRMLCKLHETEESLLEQHTRQPFQDEKGNLLADDAVRSKAYSVIINEMKNQCGDGEEKLSKKDFDIALDCASGVGLTQTYSGWGTLGYMITPKFRRILELARRGSPNNSDSSKPVQ